MLLGSGCVEKLGFRLDVDDRWSDDCALKHTLRECGGEPKSVSLVAYRRSWEETGQEEYDQRGADQDRVFSLQIIVS